ncbi:DUF4232 domain-containing protein [Nocardioides sp. R-C-SC26]|uniref:DUF4232 domain-containing protein n=1 Tax=Nocardioides sp. R-C-SC26 TaxID=2870414 RepID=UPI001E63FB9C|nr:DUF4232 domain-containing protein [Nocardioides sp. R-C-SC26]
MNERRTVARVAVGLVLAGSLVMVPGPSADAAAPARVPQCGNADLTASYRVTDAGVGHRYGVLVLRNTSDHECRTGGYGGLSYVGGGDGVQVGAAADRTPGRSRTFVVEPGERVRSRVDEVVAENYPRRMCEPTPVDGFRVYVPNATRSQFVEHTTTGCASDQVHLIQHGPFRAA